MSVTSKFDRGTPKAEKCGACGKRRLVCNGCHRCDDCLHDPGCNLACFGVPHTMTDRSHAFRRKLRECLRIVLASGVPVGVIRQAVNDILDQMETDR